jgi:hypothetical protein
MSMSEHVFLSITIWIVGCFILGKLADIYDEVKKLNSKDSSND